MRWPEPRWIRVTTARAREEMKVVLNTAPTERACLMMADIEEGQHGDTGRVREWLSRAVNAPRDPVWTDGTYVSKTWAPISPATGEIDAFEWRVPMENIGGTPQAIDYASLADAPAKAAETNRCRPQMRTSGAEGHRLDCQACHRDADIKPMRAPVEKPVPRAVGARCIGHRQRQLLPTRLSLHPLQRIPGRIQWKRCRERSGHQRHSAAISNTAGFTAPGMSYDSAIGCGGTLLFSRSEQAKAVGNATRARPIMSIPSVHRKSLHRRKPHCHRSSTARRLPRLKAKQATPIKPPVKPEAAQYVSNRLQRHKT